MSDTHAELSALILALLEEGEQEFEGELDDETPLLSSGLLDSLAILELAEWVDGHIAAPIDLNTTNIRQEWDTIAKLLDYVRRHA